MRARTAITAKAGQSKAAGGGASSSLLSARTVSGPRKISAAITVQSEITGNEGEEDGRWTRGQRSVQGHRRARRAPSKATRADRSLQAHVTILGTDACGDWRLLNAPVPKSSSVPNDRIPPGSSLGYRQPLTWPGEDLLF